ncbi:hypothetical protein QVD99_005380 [Batrachochytrium dendrobatidis]|nr:hypothetical protein QVD99_005380 [Batrachochytrium dendrobatidis]
MYPTNGSFLAGRQLSLVHHQTALERLPASAALPSAAGRYRSGTIGGSLLSGVASKHSLIMDLMSENRRAPTTDATNRDGNARLGTSQQSRYSQPEKKVKRVKQPAAESKKMLFAINDSNKQVSESKIDDSSESIVTSKSSIIEGVLLIDNGSSTLLESGISPKKNTFTNARFLPKGKMMKHSKTKMAFEILDIAAKPKLPKNPKPQSYTSLDSVMPSIRSISTQPLLAETSTLTTESKKYKSAPVLLTRISSSPDLQETQHLSDLYNQQHVSAPHLTLLPEQTKLKSQESGIEQESTVIKPLLSNSRSRSKSLCSGIESKAKWSPKEAMTWACSSIINTEIAQSRKALKMIRKRSTNKQIQKWYSVPQAALTKKPFSGKNNPIRQTPSTPDIHSEIEMGALLEKMKSLGTIKSQRDLKKRLQDHADHLIKHEEAHKQQKEQSEQKKGKEQAWKEFLQRRAEVHGLNQTLQSLFESVQLGHHYPKQVHADGEINSPAIERQIDSLSQSNGEFSNLINRV